MWRHLPAVTEHGPREDNVLFATWYDGLALLPDDAPLAADDFDRLARVARGSQPDAGADARRR